LKLRFRDPDPSSAGGGIRTFASLQPAYLIDDSGVFAECLLPGVVPEMMRGRTRLTGVPSHCPGPAASRQGQARRLFGNCVVRLTALSRGPHFPKSREIGTSGKISAQIEVASLKNAEIFEKL